MLRHSCVAANARMQCQRARGLSPATAPRGAFSVIGIIGIVGTASTGQSLPLAQILRRCSTRFTEQYAVYR